MAAAREAAPRRPRGWEQRAADRLTPADDASSLRLGRTGASEATRFALELMLQGGMIISYNQSLISSDQSSALAPQSEPVDPRRPDLPWS